MLTSEGKIARGDKVNLRLNWFIRAILSGRDTQNQLRSLPVTAHDGQV